MYVKRVIFLHCIFVLLSLWSFSLCVKCHGAYTCISCGQCAYTCISWSQGAYTYISLGILKILFHVCQLHKPRLSGIVLQPGSGRGEGVGSVYFAFIISGLVLFQQIIFTHQGSNSYGIYGVYSDLGEGKYE